MCMLQKGSSRSCMLKWDNKLWNHKSLHGSPHHLQMTRNSMQQGKNRDKYNYSGFWEQFAIWSHEIDFQSHKSEPTSKAWFEFIYIACQKWKQKLDAACQQWNQNLDMGCWSNSSSSLLVTQGNVQRNRNPWRKSWFWRNMGDGLDKHKKLSAIYIWINICVYGHSLLQAYNWRHHHPFWSPRRLSSNDPGQDTWSSLQSPCRLTVNCSSTDCPSPAQTNSCPKFPLIIWLFDCRPSICSICGGESTNLHRESPCNLSFHRTNGLCVNYPWIYIPIRMCIFLTLISGSNHACEVRLDASWQSHSLVRVMRNDMARFTVCSFWNRFHIHTWLHHFCS